MEKCRRESSCWKRLQTAESLTEEFPKHPGGWSPADPRPPPHGIPSPFPLWGHSCSKQVLDWEGLCETIWLGLAALTQQNLLVEEWKSLLEFQVTCGCRHSMAVWPGRVYDTNHSWSDLRGVLDFYWQRFITMSFSWVGGGSCQKLAGMSSGPRL